MKSATKYIFTAIGMEIIVAIATAFFIFDRENMLFIFHTELIVHYIFSLLIILLIAYFLGQKIEYKMQTKNSRKWKGILLMFSFLYFFICILIITANPYRTIKEFNIIMETIIIYLAYTTLFGGIQTLLIGIWLGYKLSRIRNETNFIG